ncbi:condensation domain-containing protein [Nocardia sp. XZ_19_385]|uniref:condensation domain-containing protein n=1 Tax=Nocardia sp. XZ_19_385 TaxID=2769488 RepID=UPI00188E6F5D|nr:condensation domain-containing protein [Nocardia sp. XZ_19_385]
MTDSDTARPTDIAIVGIGARFPHAADLAEFRRNLAAGRDSVGPMPPGRIAATGLNPSVTYLPMGHLSDIEQFDYRFFGLSRREAAVMDPQQRLALLLAHRAIEDAGYATASLARSVTAVALSAGQSSYHSLAVDPGPLSLLGNAAFAGPARIAHRFGLTGACFGVDSGCNSALVAVHQVCRELACGDADYALAGGVAVRVHGTPSWGGGGFSEIMSPSGVCRAFDAEADGTVNGEGGAVLLLTTVARAQADRVPIYAVIRGSSTRHNGAAAATISTPSATGQATVIEKAWADAGLDPLTAGYLETHGSGTRLGDAVELEGISAVFGGSGRVLPIGSVKTNIGHLDHASAIAGLVKAVLSVSEGELYPSLHFTRATGGFDLEGAGIEVLTAARPWADDKPRVAGVSSFSLGGSVAHCVVAQAPSVSVPPSSGRMRLIGVSARSPQALTELCIQLGGALRQSSADLDEVAATLALGRAHYDFRVAVTASSTAELADVLDEAAVITHPEPSKPRVVLLLSPDAVPTGAMPDSSLPEHLPATGDTARVLAGQIAVHARLQECGIEFAALLSAGSSRYLSRYLLGSRGPVDARELADAAPTVDTDRLLAAVHALRADGPVVFVEPSPGGRLGALIAESDPDAEIVTAAADSTDLDELIGRLYEYGVDVDWNALAPADAHRVRLPGHPMQEERCWVDLPHAQNVLSSRVATRGHAVADPQLWLRETLAELLGTHEDMDEDANYFALGGNSLIAIQLVDRIEETFGFRPKLLDIYERPRLADFARLLTVAEAKTPQRAPIPALVAHDEPVMSSGQERMWFHHQFDPDTTLYNYPVVQLLRGPIDTVALQGTFDDLIERHETLRYNFAEVDGLPVLRIRDRLEGYFRVVDVSAEADPTAAARALVHTAAQTPFDLGAEPLLRVLVVTLEPEAHVLQLVCHHAVTDGATPVILARELPELYAARAEGRPHGLPPLPIRYRDYAAWHRRLLQSSALDHELEYWRTELTGAPILALPTDFPRPPRKTYVGDLHPFTLPADLITELRTLAQRESVSLFVVLLSAFYLTLARRSGQRDIVIGTPTTGRGRREFQDLIGYFNSTVALRTDFGTDRALSELLTRVRSNVLGALEHQEIPFDRVVNALVEQRDLSRTPLFDVLYIHQVTPRMERGDEAGAELFDLEHSAGNEFGGLPTGTAKFDLTLVTFEYTDTIPRDISACLEFSTELFTRQTVAAIAAEFLEILTAIIAPAPPTIDTLIAGPAPTASPLLIPTDRPRTGERTFDHELASHPLEFHALDTPATFDAALFDAYSVLLAWYSGQSRVPIRLPDSPAGQPRYATAELPQDATWRTLRDRGPVVGDTSDSPVRYHGLITDTDSLPTPTAELELFWTPQPPALQLNYATELFDRASAEDLLADLSRLLEAALTRPDECVYDTASADFEYETEVHP